MSQPSDSHSAFSRAWSELHAGLFFEAHETWEHLWKGLAEPDRSYVKACIQLAGLLHLVRKGRLAPAERLARRAMELLAGSEAHAKLLGVELTWEAEGAEAILLQLVARLRIGAMPEDLLAFWESQKPSLRLKNAPWPT